MNQRHRISRESFAARRARFQAQLGCGIAIIPGAAGASHPFRQNSDLRYLTGFGQPHALALLTASEFVLFVEPRDPEIEIWTGRRVGVEGALEQFDADEAYPIGELEVRLASAFEDVPRVWYRYGDERSRDELVQRALQAVRAKERKGVQSPVEFADPYPLLHEARLTKDDEELAVLRHAAEISLEAHHCAARNCRAGTYEYEIEAELFRIFRARGGAGPAYPSIVGSGENATILHYVENASALAAGEMVLIDAGVEYEGYASDVTRCYPVGGRFDGVAGEVYAAVLRAQELAIASVQPGTTLKAIHGVAIRALVEALIEFGALEGEIDELIETEAYRPFYMHGTSHFLGLDVHDAGMYHVDGRPRELRAGMCFTVEPGLYFSESNAAVPEHLRGIGVRIEDDLAMTETGFEILTEQIPKQIDDIEAWMRE